MKYNRFKKLIYTVCGVMAFGTAFTACHLEPYEIPAEEMYLRNFITKYGLIDPTQDWNMSTPTQVTVVPNGNISKLNVMVECGGQQYRVAEYANVGSTVTIPVDVPDGTKCLYVEADGEVTAIEPGGIADFSKGSRAESRAINPSQGYEWGIGTPDRYTIDQNSTSSQYIDCVSYGGGQYLHLGDWTKLDDQAAALPAGDRYAEIDNPDYNSSQPESTSNPKKIKVQYQNRNGVGTTECGTNKAKFVLAIHNDYRHQYKFTFKTGLAKSGGAQDPQAHIQVYIVDADGNQYIARESTVECTGEWEWTPSQLHTYITPILPDIDLRVIVVAESTNHIWNYAGNWTDFAFEPYGEGKIEDMAWLMVAEDLGATDDFDFNDIIIRMECVTVNTAIYNQEWQVITDDSQHSLLGRASESTYKRIKVTGLTAGGTLPLYLHFYDKNDRQDYIIGFDDEVIHRAGLKDDNNDYSAHEWHRWFGYDDVRKMINTGVNTENVAIYTPIFFKTVEFFVGADFKIGEYSKYIDYDMVIANILKDEPVVENWDWDLQDTPNNYLIQGFYITVGGPTLERCKTAVYAPKPGAAPQAFLIPDVGAHQQGWEWPTERTNITNVYGYFTKWAKSGGVTDDISVNNWYLYQNGSNTQSMQDYCPRDIYSPIQGK